MNNSLQAKSYLKKPACYQIEWADALYVGHTSNAYRRFLAHLSYARQGYHLTRVKDKGQTDLYGKDWSQAKVTVEYFETKNDAWRREHELYRFWQPTGKLLNKQPPMRGGVLAINLINGKRKVFSSSRDAAKFLGLNSANIRAVCSGKKLTYHDYTFEYL